MRVLHLIDSLSAGGAERVAVNTVNALNGAGIETYLCATRKEGPLKSFLQYRDRYLFLNKKRRLDVRAQMMLIRFIKQNRIQVLHAHSSSFFIAVLSKCFLRRVKIVWHDHYGLSDQLASRRSFPIRIASFFFDAVFSVNHTLRSWAAKHLFVSASRVKYLPNYADLGKDYVASWHEGRLAKANLLCLANLRPQKDHTSLIYAFEKIKKVHPKASLYLVGKDSNDAYSVSLRHLVEKLSLPDVFFMGEQTNVIRFLNEASIGILSSASEGLPLALLEYGVAALPVVCTDVGECRTVLGNGEKGVLIPSGNVEMMADAVLTLLGKPDVAGRYSAAFHQHITREYSSEQVLHQLTDLYKAISLN